MPEKDRLPEITRAVRALFRPGDIIETRAFDKNHGRFVGRFAFDDLALATAAQDLDTLAWPRDVYYCCNPTRLSPVAAATEGTKGMDPSSKEPDKMSGDRVTVVRLSTLDRMLSLPLTENGHPQKEFFNSLIFFRQVRRRSRKTRH